MSNEDARPDVACSARLGHEGMSTWQPIDTAPQDGTVVLVYPPLWAGFTCSLARYDSDSYAQKPRPYWKRMDDMGRVSASRGRPPTHWMPQPTPPAAA